MEQEHISIQEKIIKHLEGLNELERQQGSEEMIQTLAERYDVSVPVIEKALAEWQAGHVDDDNLEEDISSENGKKQKEED